jgi:hypothetical protein
MRDEELDRILDAALERYSDVEPLGGLQERILRAVRREGRPRFRGWMAVGGFATAALVGILALHSSHRTYVAQVAGHSRPVVAQRKETPVVVNPVRRVHRHFERAKQLVFPIPTPMTSEEKSLAVLASGGPSVFPDVEKDVEPIIVAPVEVTPITTEVISNLN